MSFMDKLKAMFSGGSDAHDRDHSDTGHDRANEHEDLAVGDVPPAPVDPIGTPMPGAPPATTPPPADPDERP